jgi:hypothetical protein
MGGMSEYVISIPGSVNEYKLGLPVDGITGFNSLNCIGK